MGGNVIPHSSHPSRPSHSLATASESLRRGQSHEARGEFSAAVACYDESIAILAPLPAAPESQRALAIAWMNRGNALRKCHVLRDTSPSAITAYERAIALLTTLLEAAPADHALRNSLGAAHLNLASVRLGCDASSASRESAERAVSTLSSLPLERNIFYRTNLAGAWLNRASALLTIDLEIARISARTALALVAGAAAEHLAAGHAALGAQRTLLAVIGRELSLPRDDTAQLLTEASDLIDTGLTLARVWEARRIVAFRPAAAQLFHAGAILYAWHQPHFLVEFLEENEALARELPAVVQTMIARAYRAAHERSLITGSADPLSRTLATLSELRAIGERFTSLFSATAPLSP